MTAFLGTAVNIPAGSLSIWKAARGVTASSLVEVLVMSDSTGFGQTPTGSGQEAPWPYKLRALFLAAGATDGGRGLTGHKNETLASSGENVIAVSSVTGFSVAGGITETLANYTYVSTTNGDTITFTGKGTRARIISTQAGSSSGGFTYSLDGGSAVTVVGGSSNGELVTFVGPFSEGTHTLTITNNGTNGGYVGVTVDWYRAAGLVIHNMSVPGISSTYVGLNGTTSETWPGRIEAAFGLATSSDTSIPEYQRSPAGGNARNVKLAIFALGMNDQQQSSSDNTAQVVTAATKFCKIVRAAGADPLLIVQHFEGGAQNQNAGLYRAAVYGVAKAQHAAVVDFGVGCLGPASQWVSRGYINSLTNPHLYDAGYTLQAARLYDALSA